MSPKSHPTRVGAALFSLLCAITSNVRADDADALRERPFHLLTLASPWARGSTMSVVWVATVAHDHGTLSASSLSQYAQPADIVEGGAWVTDAAVFRDLRSYPPAEIADWLREAPTTAAFAIDPQSLCDETVRSALGRHRTSTLSLVVHEAPSVEHLRCLESATPATIHVAFQDEARGDAALGTWLSLDGLSARTRSLATGAVSQAAVFRLGRMRQLTGLALRIAPGVTTLEPVGALTELRTLDLWATPVTDVSPIRSLVKLRSLNLGMTEVSDLAPLRSLVALEALSIDGVPATSLAPLAQIASLRSLCIAAPDEGAHIDLSPLAAFTELRALDVRGYAASELEAVRMLTKLEALSLFDAGLRDLSLIANLTRLKQLDLTLNDLVDITVLSRLSSLENLTFSADDLDLAPIASLTRLRSLDLGRWQTRDVSTLSRLTNLEHLRVGTPGGTLDFLPNAPRLRTLFVLGELVTDTTKLRSFPLLRALAIKANDIEFVRSLPELSALGIRSAVPLTLDPLTTASRLERLEIDARVRSLEPLRTLARVRTLALRGAGASSYAPIGALSRLLELDINDPALRDISFVTSLGALRSLDVRSTGATSVSMLEGLPKLVSVTLSDRVPERQQAPLRARGIDVAAY